MKVEWEKTGKHEGVLTVEVEEEKVRDALNKAFQKIRKQLNVPGFRKGKVPRQVFEARFGVEALYQDALDILLPESYSQAVQEANIEPVVQPKVDIEQIEKGKPFIFKATVTVKPEVQLGEYKNLEIPEKDFTFTEEDVDNELNALRERYAELEVVEEKAEKGDFVTIDFEGFIDGEPFERGKGEHYTLELGSGRFIEGFEDQLVGSQAGEDREVVVTFPDDYHQKAVAGKEATFKVHVREVKRKRLPELDDEFAKDVSEFETLEELKEEIRQKLQKRKEDEADQYRKDEAVKRAAENATVDIPEVMIEREIDRMIEDFERQLYMQGMNLEAYLNASGEEEDSLREQFKEEAENRVKHSLVLEAIAKAENIQVSDEDVEKELSVFAERTNRKLEDVRKMFKREDQLQQLKDELLFRKTIELLVSNSQNAA